MTRQNPEEEVDIGTVDEEESGLAWGVEVEFVDELQKSVFYSARTVSLSGEYIEIQLLDGKYAVHAIETVRKVLSMRTKPVPSYTDKTQIPDEFY